MTDTDFARVADAISFLTEHATEQPGLDEIAARVGLSPFHFQRTFRRYAGVTPKQFLAALTVESAKTLLDRDTSVLDASLDLGLSGPARLHDHFVTIEAMTPGEYKSGGEAMRIAYGFAQTPFGIMIAGRTTRGICMLEFIDGVSFDPATSAFPRAHYERDDNVAQALIPQLFESPAQGALRVHVRGTNFQLRVWNALLKIAAGSVTTYKAVAQSLALPTGARAVGNAAANNPVAILIPCHRVIAASGAMNGYRWGTERKRALLAWEHARSHTSTAIASS